MADNSGKGAGDAVIVPKIMLIRHAEKPPEDPPPHGVTAGGKRDAESLTVRGWQRAGALAAALAPSSGSVSNDALAVPRFVFASRLAKHAGSRRPQQTVTPLIARLGKDLTVNFDVGKEEADDLVAKVIACDGVVLVCWEHAAMPPIVSALLRRLPVARKSAAAVPADWPEPRFDLVWVFDRNPTSRDYRFSQQPQLLLAGDRPV